MCQELEEARRRHAHDTAQGDDVTVALEKEREKLQQDVRFYFIYVKRNMCNKKMLIFFFELSFLFLKIH